MYVFCLLVHTSGRRYMSFPFSLTKPSCFHHFSLSSHFSQFKKIGIGRLREACGGMRRFNSQNFRPAAGHHVSPSQKRAWQGRNCVDQRGRWSLSCLKLLIPQCQAADFEIGDRLLFRFGQACVAHIPRAVVFVWQSCPLLGPTWFII